MFKILLQHYVLLSVAVLLSHVQSKRHSKKDNVMYDGKENFLASKKFHKFKPLSEGASRSLAKKNDYQDFRESYLRNILRVRVPGSVGHHEVKLFLIKNLKEYGWHVERDEFTEKTPLETTMFTNIIATLNPKADRKLALVAHYDSKVVTPKNGRYFMGATDSAVPCAMLLDFAKMLSEKYNSNKTALKEVTPMILFLDGEEAFVEWTTKDSLYGARHLAEIYSKTPHPNPRLSQYKLNVLDSLDAFMLFDLIGTKTTQFLDLYPVTSAFYDKLKNIEESLRKSNIIASEKQYFPGKPNSPLYVEDDHVPFLQKGVPILHLISIPFPKEWHTLDDNENCLDEKTISNLLIIFRQFLTEYFNFGG